MPGSSGNTAIAPSRSPNGRTPIHQLSAIGALTDASCGAIRRIVAIASVPTTAIAFAVRALQSMRPDSDGPGWWEWVWLSIGAAAYRVGSDSNDAGARRDTLAT
ncbi:MAG: hypothetical protein LW806_08745 [Planctomycetaceae bacterium]|nr:hypothetical protein [Planctomycetaceae bacterium]